MPDNLHRCSFIPIMNEGYRLQTQVGLADSIGDDVPLINGPGLSVFFFCTCPNNSGGSTLIDLLIALSS
jgi:hypothetical protein